MKFKTGLFMIMLVSLVAMSPVMAFMDDTTTTVAADLIGDHSNGNTQNSLAVTADHGSSVDLSTDNSVDTHASSSASTVNFYPIIGNPDYYGMDTPVVTEPIISLYEGQVLIVMNDPGNEQMSIPGEISKPGDVYKYTIRASVPVLAYVINANDAEKAEWDSSCVPYYDQYMHKFTVGNIDKIYMSKYRSPQQQFNVTIKKEGRYSLVIDTRVSHAKNGIFSTISDDSNTIDVIYSIEKVENGSPKKFTRTALGTTDMFPILKNGMADTASPSY